MNMPILTLQPIRIVHCSKSCPAYSSAFINTGVQTESRNRFREEFSLFLKILHKIFFWYQYSVGLLFRLGSEPRWSSDYTSRLSSGRPGFDPRRWLPHIIHLVVVYIRRIHHRPTDGDVTWRPRVSELYSGHVKEPGWLWWNSMFFCIRFLSLLSFF